MNINSVSFASNQINYAKNNSAAKNQVTFQGARGDEYVRQITTGSEVKSQDIMKEVKGTFGIKADRFEDIMESFITTIKDLTKDNRKLQQNLYEAKEEISQFPYKQSKLQSDIECRMIKMRNEALAAKDKEVEAAKAEAKALEKYKPLMNVKSIEEIGTVMPEKALETYKEMAEHKTEATKSMFNFLTTGKGQEELLEQLNRATIMQKASRDGVLNIPSVKEGIDNIAKENGPFHWRRNWQLALEMLEEALEGTPKGECIVSTSIKEQIKKNAMALLTPLADEENSNIDVKSLEKKLDDSLKEIVKFHRNFKAGIKFLENRYGKENVEIKPVEFNLKKSKVVVTHKGQEYDNEYWQVTDCGHNHPIC